MKTAIVTGASSGIGRSTAIALLQAGYNVVCSGRRVEALHETIALANTEKEHALAVQIDVTDPASVSNLFNQTKSKFGRLDVLFNNAGISSKGMDLEEVPFDHWMDVVNTNLTGVFLCMQEAFKMMKDQEPQGGRIINNGSISAHVPRPNSAPYTAAKHGVTGLTRSGSLDGRKYNIAVGQIDIGNALTPMARKMTTGMPQADGRIATEPTMDVDNVARTIVYMAGLPLDTNVPFVTIMANGMPYMGRG